MIVSLTDLDTAYSMFDLNLSHTSVHLSFSFVNTDVLLFGIFDQTLAMQASCDMATISVFGW
jgi:hypothetical protein